jgi:hypothetical protein
MRSGRHRLAALNLVVSKRVNAAILVALKAVTPLWLAANRRENT